MQQIIYITMFVSVNVRVTGPRIIWGWPTFSDMQYLCWEAGMTVSQASPEMKFWATTKQTSLQASKLS